MKPSVSNISTFPLIQFQAKRTGALVLKLVNPSMDSETRDQVRCFIILYIRKIK